MNYLAVLVAALVPMVVGMLWYSKSLFGIQWMKLIGKSEKDLEKQKKNMGRLYGVSFLAALVMAYVLSQFVHYASATTIMSGAMVGLWAWLGFVATVLLTKNLFAELPLELYYLDAGYYLVNLLIMGALLAVWV